MVALGEAGEEEEHADEETGGVAGEVCGVSGAGVGHEEGFKDVFADGEEDDVDGGDFPAVDVEEEPDEEADLGLREEREVHAGDGGDGTAGPEGATVGHEDLAAAGKDASGEEEGEVSGVAEFFVEVVAEDVEEKHVEEDVGEAEVEELVGEELVEGGILGIEHELGPTGGEAGVSGGRE